MTQEFQQLPAKSAELSGAGLELADLHFVSGAERGFYAAGAAYYILGALTPAASQITGASHKLILLDIYCRPIGYTYGVPEALQGAARLLGTVALDNAQATALPSLNLQDIAHVHYDVELAESYGAVNTASKDAERRYRSAFPSLRPGEPVSLVEDLHAPLQALRPSGRSLDVGCGRGKDVLRYRRAGYDAHGIDASEVQIRGAEEVLAKAGVPCGSVQQIDILTGGHDLGGFDLITCSHVYQHFTLEQALYATRAMLGLLNDGGVLLVNLKMNVACWLRYLQEGVRLQAEDLSQGVFSMWDPDLAAWRPGYHLFLGTEMSGIIKAAGAKVVNIPTWQGERAGVIDHDSSRNYPCCAYYLQRA